MHQLPKSIDVDAFTRPRGWWRLRQGHLRDIGEILSLRVKREVDYSLDELTRHQLNNDVRRRT